MSYLLISFANDAQTLAQFHETLTPTKTFQNPSFPHVSYSNSKHYDTQQNHVQKTQQNEKEIL